MANVWSGLVRVGSSEGLSFVLFAIDLSATWVRSSVEVCCILFLLLLVFPRKIRLLFVLGVDGAGPAVIDSGFLEEFG